MLHPFLRAALASVIALTGVGAAVAADPVEWRTDYATARKEAEEKKLPLLVVVGTEQCVYCRKLEATTFVDKDVLALLAGKVVLLKVDANKDAEFARAMRVTIYPTTVIAGADGKVFAYLAGYVAADQFKEHATKAFGLIASADKEKPKANADAVLTSRVKPDAKPLDPADTLRESLDLAKVAYKAERYAEVLERAEALAAGKPGTPAAEEAAGLIAAVKADPDKLSRAGEQLDEKAAAAYFSVAEGFEQRGKLKDAAAYFDKVIAVSPGSKLAERARVRVSAIARTELDGKLIK